MFINNLINRNSAHTSILLGRKLWVKLEGLADQLPAPVDMSFAVFLIFVDHGLLLLHSLLSPLVSSLCPLSFHASWESYLLAINSSHISSPAIFFRGVSVLTYFVYLFSPISPYPTISSLVIPSWSAGLVFLDCLSHCKGMRTPLATQLWVFQVTSEWNMCT